jgi:hypothetical protein
MYQRNVTLAEKSVNRWHRGSRCSPWLPLQSDMAGGLGQTCSFRVPSAPAGLCADSTRSRLRLHHHPATGHVCTDPRARRRQTLHPDPWVLPIAAYQTP